MNKEVLNELLAAIRETRNDIQKLNMMNEYEVLKISIKNPELQIVEEYYKMKEV